MRSIGTHMGFFFQRKDKIKLQKRSWLLSKNAQNFYFHKGLRTLPLIGSSSLKQSLLVYIFSRKRKVQILYFMPCLWKRKSHAQNFIEIGPTSVQRLPHE